MGKKVYIAEKPKLGKAIAEQLAKRSPRVDYGREFVAGKDWLVCWAAGHIFGQEDPDFYISSKFPGAPKGKSGKISWSLDHLPLLPGQQGWSDWALRLDKEKAGLFKTIKKYVGEADIVVNAGDPDREGQLLIDEILHELGNKKPVRRVLISAFDEVSVNNGLRNERDNTEFAGMMQAAQARSRADWLCGMNFSRAATLHARSSSQYGGVISIGRVQTPLLGLIVQRHLEIQNFKPVDYFYLTAAIKVAAGSFVARWRPQEGQTGLDEAGRLLDRKVADQLNALVKGKTGKILEYSDQEKQEGPFLPFSVDKLQVLASRKYGYKSDEVLATIQSLYERHGLTTYPRSDCQFLPEGQLADAPQVHAAVIHNLNFSQEVLSQVDLSRKSRAWNDSKVTAHHAIIPTTTKADLSVLNSMERNLYDEICRRYLAQFMPNRKYRAVSATVDICGQHFVASGTTTISPGWRLLYGSSDGMDGDSSEENTILPPMKQGEPAQCNGLDIQAKKTEPPKYFTDSTLLEAMINIHKFVTDERVKAIFMKMLADKKAGDEEGGCGLGTPATRHTFVPKLIDVGLVERSNAGKKSKETFLIPTPAGVALIQALPTELGRPDMTALWEASMQEIEQGRSSVDRFLSIQANWITKTIEKLCSSPLNLPEAVGAGSSSGKGYSRQAQAGPRTSKAPAKPTDKSCPKCGSALVERKGAHGPFLGCTGYPNCKHIEKVGSQA